MMPEKKSLTAALNWVLPLSLAILLTFYFWRIDSVKAFWYDEILTHYPATDSSLAHVLLVNRDAMNTTPPLYFVTIWLYAKVFGTGTTVLRLYSLLAICASIPLLWLMMRRRYGILGASVGLTGVFSANIVIVQLAEARFYGLYFLLATVHLWCYVRLQENATRTNRVLVFLTTLGMLFTHTIGLLFSAALLAGQLWVDWRAVRGSKVPVYKALSLKNYLTVILAWVTFFAIWGEVIISQQAALKGTPLLDLSSPLKFVDLLSAQSRLVKPIMLLPLCIYFAALFLRRKREHIAVAAPSEVGEDYLLVGSWCFLFITPFVSYILSQGISTIMIDRYMMPHWIGYGVVCAWGFQQVEPFLRRNHPNLPAALCAGVCFLLFAGNVYTFRLIHDEARSLDNVMDRLSPLVRKAQEYGGGYSPSRSNLPVVYTDVLLFGPAYHYRTADKVVFLDDKRLEWTGSPENRTHLTGVQNVRMWHKHYPDVPLEQTENFLRQHPKFVLVDAQSQDFVGKAFADPAKYSVQLIDSLERDGHRGTVNRNMDLRIYLINRMEVR